MVTSSSSNEGAVVSETPTAVFQAATPATTLFPTASLPMLQLKPNNVTVPMDNIPIFLTGPPGAGKTTQIDMLKSHFAKHLPAYHLHLITGKNCKKEGENMVTLEQQMPFVEANDLEAQELIKINKFKSCMVLDHLVHKLKVQEQNEPFFWIFSRGPATRGYARILNQYFNILPCVYLVLDLDDEDILVERVLNRRFDPVQRVTYSMLEHAETEQVKQYFKRIGDTRENFPKRLKKYKERSSQVLSYYQNECGIPVIRLSALRSREEIHQDILTVVYHIIEKYTSCK